MFFRPTIRDAASIAFAFVATHNHFVLDRGGKVFKQSAPVIKLPPTRPRTTTCAARPAQQLDRVLLDEAGVFPKGGDHVGQEGARVRTYMVGRAVRIRWHEAETVPVVEAPVSLICLRNATLPSGARARQCLYDSAIVGSTDCCEPRLTRGRRDVRVASRADDFASGRTRLAGVLGCTA